MADPAERIPPHVRTDRGGLTIEDDEPVTLRLRPALERLAQPPQPSLAHLEDLLREHFDLMEKRTAALYVRVGELETLLLDLRLR